MKFLIGFLGLFSIFGVLSDSFAAEAQVSVPQGFISWNLQTGRSQIISAPLSESPVYHGVVNQVSQDAVAVAGAPWTPNEFAGSYLIHFLTGSQEGRFLGIASNGGGSVTVKVGGTPLTQPGYAVAMGDQFEITPMETLDTLFGATKEELVLQAGSKETADLVALFVAGAWVEYRFDVAEEKWTPLDETHGLTMPPPVIPGMPIRVTRRGPDKRLLLFGEVPTSAASLQLQDEETPFGWPFPIDQPLKDLLVKGPATWERSVTADGADWLIESAGDEAYFQAPTGSWMKASGGASAGEFKMPTGGGFSLVKKTWPVPLKFHSLPLPYSVAPGAAPAKQPGSQAISFQLPGKQEFTTVAIPLRARASSGLPITFTVSGSARISSARLYLSGLGQVTVTARQMGNEAHARAADVVRRTYVVDSTGPVLSKLPGSVRTKKSSLRIYGVARDNYRVNSLRFRVKGPDGRMTSFRKVAVRSNPGSPKSFSIPVSTTASGRYEVQVQVLDVSGNKSSLKKIRVTKR